MLRREEDEGAMNRSVLGIDASRPCSPVELEAQRLQAGAVEAQALGASARTPGLFESKEMFQKCLQELREENDALRMGNSLGRTEMFARPAGLSTMPGGMAPSPQPTMVRSYSPRARAPPAPQVIVHRQPRASSPLRGVASAPQGQASAPTAFPPLPLGLDGQCRWPAPSQQAVQQAMACLPQLDEASRAQLASLHPQYAMAILWDLDARGGCEAVGDLAAFVQRAARTLLQSGPAAAAASAHASPVAAPLFGLPAGPPLPLLQFPVAAGALQPG
ncbi:unnamed protein product [Prorocentrum cordatum]|uniref:Uncharacterized protein n=1 Tax=Prorocentrum cordatum TaxID=2364126 RepID=A0ABN9RS10_9DINO|nr:unnamed protein product [Polarella glacialis]